MQFSWNLKLWSGNCFKVWKNLKFVLWERVSFGKGLTKKQTWNQTKWKHLRTTTKLWLELWNFAVKELKIMWEMLLANICFFSLNVFTGSFTLALWNFALTLSQTTNFGLFQTERVCRQQFQIWWKWQKDFQKGWKHCGKRKNCSLRAISPFPTVFSKDFYRRHLKTGLVWERFEWLTHYHTTNFRLFQTERVCRRQFPTVFS